ncbi:VOC family protein [Paracoccus sp. S-4012]|uniref:glyoxalase superfamily protein n=1 Tax=Paracoccus sp. S-4012 TaxID=2665648 RepID=UPI0012AF97F2|nr:glyoxalase superfamily protein [Paracoccus sp. S-4012]MRX51409.1 VOC family protein [Paracoccus sp. S-4012]
MPALIITETAPVLRIFDEALARGFYLDFLGFTVTFEHRFHPGAPLYLGITLGGAVLHLSGHYGDASPGATVLLRCAGLGNFQQALLARDHPHCRPGIEQQPWGREMTVTDPFGNRLRFLESL